MRFSSIHPPVISKVRRSFRKLGAKAVSIGEPAYKEVGEMEEIDVQTSVPKLPRPQPVKTPPTPKVGAVKPTTSPKTPPAPKTSATPPEPKTPKTEKVKEPPKKKTKVPEVKVEEETPEVEPLDIPDMPERPATPDVRVVAHRLLPSNVSREGSEFGRVLEIGSRPDPETGKDVSVFRTRELDEKGELIELDEDVWFSSKDEAVEGAGGPIADEDDLEEEEDDSSPEIDVLDADVFGVETSEYLEEYTYFDEDTGDVEIRDVDIQRGTWADPDTGETKEVYRWADETEDQYGDWSFDAASAKELGQEYAMSMNTDIGDLPEAEEVADDDDDNSVEFELGPKRNQAEFEPYQEGPKGPEKYQYKNLQPKEIGSEVAVASSASKPTTDALLSVMFGDPVKGMKALGSIVGLGDESKVEVIESGRYRKRYSDDVMDEGSVGMRVKVTDPMFRQAEFFIGEDSENRKFMRVEIVELDSSKAAPGGGTGAIVFSQQVANAKANGIDYISLHAAGKAHYVTLYNSLTPEEKAGTPPPFSGFYVWPRYGYNQSIESIEKTDPDLANDIRDNFPEAESIMDVMSTKDGQKWWLANGRDLLDAKFDLSDDSMSLFVLDTYLEELKNKRKDLRRYKTKAMSKNQRDEEEIDEEEDRRGGWELEQTPEEDEALDRAWEKIREWKEEQKKVNKKGSKALRRRYKSEEIEEKEEGDSFGDVAVMSPERPTSNVPSSPKPIKTPAAPKPKPALTTVPKAKEPKVERPQSPKPPNQPTPPDSSRPSLRRTPSPTVQSKIERGIVRDEAENTQEEHPNPIHAYEETLPGRSIRQGDNTTTVVFRRGISRTGSQPTAMRWENPETGEVGEWFRGRNPEQAVITNAEERFGESHQRGSQEDEVEGDAENSTSIEERKVSKKTSELLKEYTYYDESTGEKEKGKVDFEIGTWLNPQTSQYEVVFRWVDKKGQEQGEWSLDRDLVYEEGTSYAESRNEEKATETKTKLSSESVLEKNLEPKKSKARVWIEGYGAMDDEQRENIHELTKKYLGTTDATMFASAVGAPDDATVRVYERNGKMYVGVEHPKIEQMERTFKTDSEGNKYIKNELLFIAPEFRQGGFGLEMFKNEVGWAIKNGFSRIDTFGVGDGQSLKRWEKASPNERERMHPPDMGYYVWPLLGYNGPLPRFAKEAFPGLETFNELMSTEEGRNWWKYNGNSDSFSFDLSEGSKSRRMLDEYIERKKRQKEGKSLSYKFKAMKRGDNDDVDNNDKRRGDDIYLSPEDEEILREIWEEIGKEDQEKGSKKESKAMSTFLETSGGALVPPAKQSSCPKPDRLRRRKMMSRRLNPPKVKSLSESYLGLPLIRKRNP